MSGDTPSVAGNGGVPRACPGLDAPRASNNSAYSQAHDGSDAPRASGGGGAPQASAGTDAPHVVDGAGGAPHAPAGPDAPHVLDNPALASLSGPHAHFAEKRGRVLRYPVDVSPWLALPDEPDAA